MSNDEWETPQWLFDKLDDYFCFDLDACASKDNHKCEDYYTKENSILDVNPFELELLDIGTPRVIWMNPPYSNPKPFVDWAIEARKAGHQVVLLLKCDPSTKVFTKLYFAVEEPLRTTGEEEIIKWFDEAFLDSWELDYYRGINLFNKRIHFELKGEKQGSCPFPSMLVVL